jgi:RNA polymerase sigma-70 factor (ECF subfamily)
MKAPGSDPLKTRPSLIDKIRNLENEQAWSEFVRIYRPLILRISRSWRLSHEDAEDVAQKTLAWVVSRIHDYEYRPSTCPFRAWLGQKVRHLILDRFRAKTREAADLVCPTEERFENSKPFEIPDPNNGAWEERWEQEHRQALLDAASQSVRRHMSPKHYQAFDMCKLQGQPAETVAAKLGVSTDFVHLATHRVKAKLKVEIARLARHYG